MSGTRAPRPFSIYRNWGTYLKMDRLSFHGSINRVKLEEELRDPSSKDSYMVPRAKIVIEVPWQSYSKSAGEVLHANEVASWICNHLSNTMEIELSNGNRFERLFSLIDDWLREAQGILDYNNKDSYARERVENLASEANGLRCKLVQIEKIMEELRDLRDSLKEIEY